ncbi:MAG: 50S ribosomal protein L20 [bacterium]|nr:50S ribosomal protein L20 [bacterium]MDZ4299618.1 50S ribosomal protein L20 [Candidatus Sungbacteria bacterium]
MVRVKRGVIAHKRREKILKQAKGYRWGRKNKERSAKDALLHAGRNAYRGRKLKKRNARRLWQVKIGAGARAEGISYSQLIGTLHKEGIALDRKVLAALAEHYPTVFKAIIDRAASAKTAS